jgi:acetamidase/formamidase
LFDDLGILGALAEKGFYSAYSRGYFDASIPPALEIQSGEIVTIETVPGGPDNDPSLDAGFYIPSELFDIHAHSQRQLPGHILTGPVAVAGAKPGHLLEIEMLDVKLRQDWGWNMIRPSVGTLPDDFQTGRVTTIPLDRDAMMAHLE